MVKPITQFCGGCKKRKPIKGFSIGLGRCAECRAAAASQPKAPRKRKKSKTQPVGPKTWKCPNCLQRIETDKSRTALIEHKNGRGRTCVGSGHKLPERSRDALDYRLPGNFEGGGRR